MERGSHIRSGGRIVEKVDEITERATPLNLEVKNGIDFVLEVIVDEQRRGRRRV